LKDGSKAENGKKGIKRHFVNVGMFIRKIGSAKRCFVCGGK